MIVHGAPLAQFSTIPALFRALTDAATPPEHDTVHLAFEDLLLLSLLCVWWGLVLLFCLEALR